MLEGLDLHLGSFELLLFLRVADVLYLNRLLQIGWGSLTTSEQAVVVGPGFLQTGLVNGLVLTLNDEVLRL